MAKFCSECAYPINDPNAEFCPKCGAKLLVQAQTEKTPVVQKAEEQKTEHPSWYIPPSSSAPPSTQPEAQDLQNPATDSTVKKRSTVEWIAICCGGIILLVVLSAVLSAFVFGMSGSTTTPGTTSATKYNQRTVVPATPTIDPIVQIKNNAYNIPYDDLFRYNENYVGKNVYFRGKIIQIMPVFGDSYVFRVATKENEYVGYIEDILYVNYKGSRYLEDDTIDLWCRVDGLETYSAVLGNQVTVPKVTALHTELVSKASG